MIFNPRYNYKNEMPKYVMSPFLDCCCIDSHLPVSPTLICVFLLNLNSSKQRIDIIFQTAHSSFGRRRGEINVEFKLSSQKLQKLKLIFLNNISYLLFSIFEIPQPHYVFSSYKSNSKIFSLPSLPSISFIIFSHIYKLQSLTTSKS